MLITIFSYERERMLIELLNELDGFDIQVIDDGSDFTVEDKRIIRTNHEGKRGFWRKWVVARQLALGSEHDWFLFLPDDVSDINLTAIIELTDQGWDNSLMALNLLNTGDLYRWGKATTGQLDITISDNNWRECCYVDGCILTNRLTLECCEIHEVGSNWFDRPDKSSGVGHQMTMTLRKLGAIMMRPDNSLCFHGDHESKMHKEHRKKTPLISK